MLIELARTSIGDAIRRLSIERKSGDLQIRSGKLVKTAFFGEDPNWGRIMAVIGASANGSRVRQDRIDIYYGETQVTHHGTGCGKGAEARARAYLKRDEVCLTIDLKNGKEAARIWTADLSPEYARINAAYRT